MRQKRLRRTANTAVVIALVAAAAVVLGGGVGSTFAVFNAVTQNTNSDFAGGWVGAPTGPSAIASGYDNDLSWTAGTAGPVTGQALLGIDNGTNSNCTGAAYGALTTSPALTATTASYTDVNRGTSSTAGDWYCYELESTSSTAWTGVTALPALQVGLAASSIATANGGTAGKLDANDTITLTFNQQTTAAASTTALVCVYSTGTVVLGDTTGTCTAATDANSLGKLVISGGTISATEHFTNSTVTVSTAAPWTVTIKLGTISGGPATISSGSTWTYTPASDATSLTTALTTTPNTTSLKVSALPAAASSGASILVMSGTHSQIFAASAAAATGATSITVTSVAANFAYPIGSTVIDLTNNIESRASTVSTALTTTPNTTSIGVAALTGAIPSGDDILVTSGTHSQIFATSAAAAIAATSVSVTSVAANFAYPIGSTVIDATDEATACTAAKSTCQPTTTTSF